MNHRAQIHCDMDDEEWTRILADASAFDKKKDKEKQSQFELNKQRKKETIEIESRESALDVSIGADNIGYRLLKKMNPFWKEGMGLGKKNSGIVEPIEVDLRSNFDKEGIGFGFKKSTVEQKKELKVKSACFVRTNAEKFRLNSLMQDYKGCLRVIQSLQEDAQMEVEFVADDVAEYNVNEIDLDLVLPLFVSFFM